MSSISTVKENRKRMLILYVVFLAIWSVSIVIMPFASINKEITMIPIFISGGCFWIGLIGSVTMAIRINNSRKKSFYFKNEISKKNRIGMVRFFRNKEAKIADIVMFTSIICFIVANYIGNTYYLFVFLALFIFSFGMHCMLNGNNYIYLKQKIRREEKL